MLNGHNIKNGRTTKYRLHNNGQIHIEKQHVNYVIPTGHCRIRVVMYCKKSQQAFINFDLSWCFIMVFWEVDVFEHAQLICLCLVLCPL